MSALQTISPFLSVAALIVAVGYVGYDQCTTRNVQQIALDSYDMSTPEAFYKATLEMQNNGDISALMSYQSKLDPRHTKEKLKTLKVEDTKEISLPEKDDDDDSFARDEKGGADREKSNAKKNDEAKTRKVTILFLSYEQEGEEQHEVIAVERDEASGLWKETNLYKLRIREHLAKISASIDEWRDWKKVKRKRPGRRFDKSS